MLWWRVARIAGFVSIALGTLLLLGLVPPICLAIVFFTSLMEDHPLLYLCVALLLLVAGAVLLALHALHADDRADFFCTACGYDLRGCPGTGRCPECGALR